MKRRLFLIQERIVGQIDSMLSKSLKMKERETKLFSALQEGAHSVWGRNRSWDADQKWRH